MKPTAEYVRQRLDYDPETGLFTWRHRTPEPNRGWAKRYAGKVAGTTDTMGKYRRINLFNVPQLEHRLAFVWMTGEWPDGLVDHINGNGVDNRWSNLRIASRSQNWANSDYAAARSGAFYRKKDGRWISQIRRDGVYRWLGSFETREEAAAAYHEAALARGGEFSRRGNAA